jgi:hypothetical protein
MCVMNSVSCIDSHCDSVCPCVAKLIPYPICSLVSWAKWLFSEFISVSSCCKTFIFRFVYFLCFYCEFYRVMVDVRVKLRDGECVPVCLKYVLSWVSRKNVSRNDSVNLGHIIHTCLIFKKQTDSSTHSSLCIFLVIVMNKEVIATCNAPYM